MICQVLSCMETHTLPVLPVPTIVIKMINSIISTFDWVEYNGRAKMKWVSWSKVCKHVKEGRVGILDIGEVKKVFHMKFSWCILLIDNL